MQRAALFRFAAAVFGGSTLLWSAQTVFRTPAAGAVVLVTVTAAALWVVRPGWDLRPLRLGWRFALLFALVISSAAAAAAVLTWLTVPHPYDPGLDLKWALPAVAAITGVEELLFRQALYRWLELRGAAPKAAVVATAVAFGFAHLGPLIIGGANGSGFYLLQSVYLVWVGALLGEIRRWTGAWPMSWLGHFTYNVAVLYFLSAL